VLSGSLLARPPPRHVTRWSVLPAERPSRRSALHLGSVRLRRCERGQAERGEQVEALPSPPGLDNGSVEDYKLVVRLNWATS
jgi:hypothetical protein